MNSNLKNTPNLPNLPQNQYSSYPIFTPEKTNNNNYFYNNFSEEKSTRLALKYPETRLFSESKRNRLNDMKKNVCDRMMNRIMNHRKTRIDNILNSKSLIIKICQDEYYDVFYI